MSISVSQVKLPPRQAGALQAMILVFTSQLPIMGLLSIVPIIPLLVQQFGQEPNARFLIPLIITAPSICLALFSPVAGACVDRFGRRPLLLAAVALYLVCGFAPFLLTDLKAIIASRFLLGLTEAVIMTVSQMLFGDFYSEVPRRKWLAIQSAVGSLSGTTLMFIAGLLGALLGWQGPFLLYLLAFPLLMMLVFFTWEPERRADDHAPESLGSRFPFGQMALICSVTLFCAVLYYVEVLQISQVLHALGLGDTARIGTASAIAGLGVPLGALVFARFSGRGIRVHLTLVFALFAVGLIGLGKATDAYWAVAAAFVTQIGCGMLIPALINWCLGALTFEHRGRGVGLWTMAFFMGQFISPFTVTLLGGHLGGLLPAVAVFGGVALVSLLVVSAMFKFRRQTNPLTH